MLGLKMEVLIETRQLQMMNHNEANNPTGNRYERPTPLSQIGKRQLQLDAIDVHLYPNCVHDELLVQRDDVELFQQDDQRQQRERQCTYNCTRCSFNTTLKCHGCLILMLRI